MARYKRKRKKKKGNRILPIVLLGLIAWHFIPLLVAGRTLPGGVTIEGATGGFLLETELTGVSMKSEEISFDFPLVTITGGGPFGAPFQGLINGGTVTVGGKTAPIDYGRMEINSLPLSLGIQRLELSVMEGELFLVGEGEVTPFERTDGGKASVKWRCLVVGTTPKGMTLAEGLLQLSLGDHLKGVSIPEGIVGGMMGEAVDVVTGWLGKQLGKLSRDYLVLIIRADPRMEVVGTSFLQGGDLRGVSLENAFRTLWAKGGGCRG
ncbi:hypothetical protein H8D30_06620 [bacterium]|nr:hypothetical protein [bacterium]